MERPKHNSSESLPENPREKIVSEMRHVFAALGCYPLAKNPGPNRSGPFNYFKMPFDIPGLKWNKKPEQKRGHLDDFLKSVCQKETKKGGFAHLYMPALDDDGNPLVAKLGKGDLSFEANTGAAEQLQMAGVPIYVLAHKAAKDFEALPQEERAKKLAQMAKLIIAGDNIYTDPRKKMLTEMLYGKLHDSQELQPLEMPHHKDAFMAMLNNLVQKKIGVEVFQEIQDDSRKEWHARRMPDEQLGINGFDELFGPEHDAREVVEAVKNRIQADASINPESHPTIIRTLREAMSVLFDHYPPDEQKKHADYFLRCMDKSNAVLLVSAALQTGNINWVFEWDKWSREKQEFTRWFRRRLWPEPIAPQPPKEDGRLDVFEGLEKK